MYENTPGLVPGLGQLTVHYWAWVPGVRSQGPAGAGLSCLYSLLPARVQQEQGSLVCTLYCLAINLFIARIDMQLTLSVWIVR